VDQRKEVMESIEKFVMSAQANRAIGAREAESTLHPIHHHVNSCLKERRDINDGILGHK